MIVGRRSFPSYWVLVTLPGRTAKLREGNGWLSIGWCFPNLYEWVSRLEIKISSHPLKKLVGLTVPAGDLVFSFWCKRASNSDDMFFSSTLPHRIHVYYIYTHLHLPYKGQPNVGITIAYMDPTDNCNCSSKSVGFPWVFFGACETSWKLVGFNL